MTKYLNWYFYLLSNYLCFGEVFVKTYPQIPSYHPFLHFLFENHSFISYCGYICGFVAFVLSLREGYLKYQFRLFAWILLATIMVVFQSWLIIMNTLKGMIWFVLPTLLIVCNDIFAYLVGYFFGSHRLISLSPKKTWEGYLGGAFFTFVFSYILTSTLTTIPGFTCPMTTLNFTPFYYPQCDDSHITDEVYSTSFLTLSFMHSHLHVFVLSLFASIIGPFGGFFASGLKRSIKIKDFSNLIPGHGGVSDRMDCQMLMGSFTYFYLNAFLHSKVFDSASLLNGLTSS
jgi:phosphatidate cytidylyltransferase